MNEPTTNHETLFMLLADFETELDTPVVPGESSRWISDVRAAFDLLSTYLRGAVLSDHLAQFSIIASEDDELLPRVAEVKRMDGEIHGACERLSKQISQLEQRLNAASQFPDDERRSLVHEGQQLLASIRQQEIAIQTWSQEAILRDRGVVD